MNNNNNNNNACYIIYVTEFQMYRLESALLEYNIC